jgi:hypothetical protein
LHRFSTAVAFFSALGALCASGAGIIACSSVGGPSQPEIQFDSAGDRPDAATVRVAGIPSEHLRQARNWSAEQWSSALRVTVVSDAAPGAAALPPVIGRYTVERRAVVFKPEFGFDPGRRYRVVFDASKIASGEDTSQPARPERSRRAALTAVVGLPGRDLVPTTIVSHVFPSAEVVPENQLRLYVHFSAPMGLKGGIGHVRLLDETGDEVREPFLPLDAEFWNRDRTRFTVFFDPGRQKRGILPNEEMGRSLVDGRAYTLVVSREWRDAQGMPLKEEFRRRFTVGPPDERPLDQHAWRIEPPSAGGRGQLAVTFPEPLDHGLLLRALAIADRRGRRIEGESSIEAHETRWLFTPAAPWRSGEYFVQAMTILEDMAGNRIGRAFEVDEFSRVDESAEQETVAVPFRVE